MEAAVRPAKSLKRVRKGRQSIMGPFNLAWKTWVILAGGFAPDQHSESNFVHVCLSANPPIEIYPWLCHSSRVLAAQGGWGRVYSRLSKQPRGFSGKEMKVAQDYIPTWTVSTVATVLWKSSILQVFSAKLVVHICAGTITSSEMKMFQLCVCATWRRVGWKMYQHV